MEKGQFCTGKITKKKKASQDNFTYKALKNSINIMLYILYWVKNLKKGWIGLIESF